MVAYGMPTSGSDDMQLTHSCRKERAGLPCICALACLSLTAAAAANLTLPFVSIKAAPNEYR